MEKVEISFLKILEEYFSKLSDEQILVGNKQSIEIPIDWIFTEKLDRAIIQRTLVSIFEKNNSNYRERSNYKGNNPDVIESFSIQFNRFTKEIELLVLGADKWSKLLITKRKSQNIGIPQISEQEFNDEISKVLNEERLNKIISADLKLGPEASKYVQTAFAEILNFPQVTGDTSVAMCELATNLTHYYEYLIKMKSDSRIYYGDNIKQRVAEKGKGISRDTSANSADRKSLIYPFTERAEIYESLNPSYTIINGGIDEQGKVEKNAFTTYVYSNPREKDGYLCVCEPLEGSHETRMFFIPKEKYDEYEQDINSNKLIDIVRQYIEMSSDEFNNEKYTKTFRHNDIESFKSRVEYMITGKASLAVSKRLSLYQQYDEQVFEGKKVTRRDIRGAVKGMSNRNINTNQVIIALARLQLGKATSEKAIEEE